MVISATAAEWPDGGAGLQTMEEVTRKRRERRYPEDE
jgi:hypothetical protein